MFHFSYSTAPVSLLLLVIQTQITVVKSFDYLKVYEVALSLIDHNYAVCLVMKFDSLRFLSLITLFLSKLFELGLSEIIFATFQASLFSFIGLKQGLIAALFL